MASNKSRYDSTGIKIVDSGYHKGVLKRDTKFYQKIPELTDDIYVMTQEGDRFDLLANQFYGNPSLWWYIARANNVKFNNIEAGTTIRIPASVSFSNPG